MEIVRRSKQLRGVVRRMQSLWAANTVLQRCLLGRQTHNVATIRDMVVSFERLFHFGESAHRRTGELSI